MTGKPITRGVILASLVVLAAVAGTAMGAWNAQVSPSDDTAGAEDVTYTFTVNVGDDLDGTNVNGSAIELYTGYTPLNAETISAEDIELLAIDRRGDLEGTNFNALITRAIESVELIEPNRGILINLNVSQSGVPDDGVPPLAESNLDLNENDELILQISGITNPAAGDYPMKIDIHSGATGGEAEFTLSIEEEQTTTTTTTMEPTTTESGDGGPGFTLVIALVALLATALVAVRRT